MLVIRSGLTETFPDFQRCPGVLADLQRVPENTKVYLFIFELSNLELKTKLHKTFRLLDVFIFLEEILLTSCYQLKG